MHFDVFDFFPLFDITKKDHRFLINVYFKVLILLILSCHKTIRDKMFFLPKNHVSCENVKLHNSLDLTLKICEKKKKVKN